MKILVTGATGFVGSRTCIHLEEAGHEVVRVSHRASSGFAVDIGDPSSFETLDHIEDIDAVVNCAGIAHRFGRVSNKEFERVNVEGVRNVIEFCARKSVRRFVHLSSVLVYGSTSSAVPITEDHELNPQDDYSSSKLGGEQAATTACSKAGIDLVILRPVPIIGEGSRGNVSRLVRAIDRGRFVWIGNGENKKSFVYVSDVARAVEVSLVIESQHPIFNVVGGDISVGGLVKTISDRLGKGEARLHIPGSLARIGLAFSGPASGSSLVGRYRRTLETWLAESVYSGAKFKSQGFVPHTKITDGLRREVDSHLKHAN
jgi:GlcNAc-P-P-Und epimerase